MRVLYLESEDWRRQAFAQAFLRMSGQAVKVALSASIIEFASQLQYAYDAVVLPPNLDFLEDYHEATTVDEFLPWFLARQKPPLGLWRYRSEQEMDSDTVHLGRQIAIEFLDYPEEASGYLTWVERFCRENKIPYLSPAKPMDWWESRPWLVVSGDEGSRASFAVEDPEVDSDLANFFALKGAQLLDCLGGNSWLSLEFLAAEDKVAVQAAKDGHCVLFREGPASGPIPEPSLAVLKELRLVSDDV